MTTTNQAAVEALESADYDRALVLFEQAVRESRGVQALTNLAWFYYHEEGRTEDAIEAAQEAIRLRPASPFPYNLLGEIYVEQGRWEEAASLLRQAIAIEPTQAAYTNLAITSYHLGQVEEASALFLLSAEPSDYTLYSHIHCLIKLGHTAEAKQKLDAFSPDDEEYAGEIYVADLYVELQCDSEAVRWFAQGWSGWAKTPDWVSRYVYALLRMGAEATAAEIVQQCLQMQAAAIEEEYAEPCDEDWPESAKSASFAQLEADQQDYASLLSRLAAGYVPPLRFTTSLRSGCYLFGCTRHGHPEYVDNARTEG
jgi:predicted Zn-dependent protease